MPVYEISLDRQALKQERIIHSAELFNVLQAAVRKREMSQPREGLNALQSKERVVGEKEFLDSDMSFDNGVWGVKRVYVIKVEW